MYTKTLVAVLASTALLVGACSGPRYGSAPIADSSAGVSRVDYGYVDRIEVYRNGDNTPIGVGALLGGVAGGVIGHQIGGGVGNTVATIAGVIGGAIAGNEVEKNNRVEGSRYRITVRLDSGGYVTVEDNRDINLRTGDRVRVENNRVARV